MVDIDPGSAASKFTPREATLVDAVAEMKRIADQQMRSNPLKDATVDSGLTRWVGNYGSDFAWFGEFFPPDFNQVDEFGNVKPQRGISFVRDDTQRNSAFSMYDFDPRAGVPLRQRIYMHDADGHALLQEGYNGGRAFPDTPIVMYQRESFENPAATWTADRSIYTGEGNLTGTRLEFRATWTTSDGAATSVNSYLRLSGGGVTITQPTVTLAGAQNYFLDVDVKTIYNVSDFINVEWHMWRAAGAGSFLPRMYRCRTYSYLTG